MVMERFSGSARYLFNAYCGAIMFLTDNGVELFFRHKAAFDRFFAQGRAVFMRRLGDGGGIVIADFRGSAVTSMSGVPSARRYCLHWL